MNEIICACSEVVMKSSNGIGKIRNKVVVVKGEIAYAVCKACSQEVRIGTITLDNVPVPLILSK